MTDFVHESLAGMFLVDELGYLQLDRRGAELLFQVLTEREERSAIAIASNEPFSSWTKTFTDPTTVRSHRRPSDLRRPDHRNRDFVLSTRPRPPAARRQLIETCSGPRKTVARYSPGKCWSPT